MISYSYLYLHFFGIFIFTSAFICGIVGSSNQNADREVSIQDGSLAIRNSSMELCERLLQSKNLLVSKLKELNLSYAGCNVSDNCLNLSCRGLIGEDKIKLGVSLNLCQPPATAFGVWMVLPMIHKKWSHMFPTADSFQRIEINRDMITHIKSGAKWFINVRFLLKQNDAGEEYFSLNSSLQICESEYQSLCKNLTLLDLPYHRIRGTCDFPQSSLAHQKHSNRSSRSASNIEDMHTNQKASQSLLVGSTSLKIGETCNTGNIFGCGSGATCISVSEGKGVCKCLNNYEADSSGVCKESPSLGPTDPPSQPIDNNSSSFSAVLGALLSVCILFTIAAAIFFGAKYQVLTRIRSRLPLSLRCWPWPRLRRSNHFQDNVSMVNPIDLEDDDPLLL